jgi:predicted SAM-dependent methyltransferase
MPASWRRISAAVAEKKSSEVLLNRREQQIEAYLARPGARKLQIGAGENLLPEWLNSDLEPVQAGCIFLNALAQFPFSDQAFDYIYSEHMIEHIPYLGGLHMLQECFRVLKPGGKIRIATPDVRRITGLLSPEKNAAMQQYIEWSVTRSLGLYLPEKSPLQARRAEWDIDHEHILRQYPDIRRDPACFVVNNFFRSYGHQFLYDETTLSGILREAGFNRIARFSPGESDDDNLCHLESHGRLIGEEYNLYETMILQAERPETAQAADPGLAWREPSDRPRGVAAEGELRRR